MNQFLHRAATPSARRPHNLSHAIQHGGHGGHDAGRHDVIVPTMGRSLPDVACQSPVSVAHVFHGGKPADVDIRYDDRLGKQFDGKHISPRGICVSQQEGSLTAGIRETKLNRLFHRVSTGTCLTVPYRRAA